MFNKVVVIIIIIKRVTNLRTKNLSKLLLKKKAGKLGYSFLPNPSFIKFEKCFGFLKICSISIHSKFITHY